MKKRIPNTCGLRAVLEDQDAINDAIQADPGFQQMLVEESVRPEELREIIREVIEVYDTL